MPRRRTPVLPSEGAYQNNAACVGGGTLSYGAQAWRYMPQDFRMRSTYGAPQGSSLEDWPISYDDLEPFYEKAEYEIGVSGDYSPTPFHGPRRVRCPCRRCRPTASSESSSLPQSARPASVSHSHGAQQRSLQRSRPLYALPLVLRIRLRSGRQKRLAEHRNPVALDTGNCELRTECMVKEILTDDRGRARGVAYFDDAATCRNNSPTSSSSPPAPSSPRACC